jgi:uncharacterized protein involved in exopolysaccharide biosynthesis/Mrp family chromosome partitioning ATPase
MGKDARSQTGTNSKSTGKKMNPLTGAPNGQYPGSGEPFTPFPLLKVLVRRRWQLLACLLLVCSIAFAATTLRKPRYEATAQAQVIMDIPRIGNTQGTSYTESGNYFNTQCQLLQSRHVLTQAAEKLYAMGGSSGGSGGVNTSQLEDLKSSIKVAPVSGSQLIDITGVAEEGAIAAAIANQLTAAFIETSKEARKAANQRIEEQVKAQIESLNEKIVAQEEEINQYRQENLITGADTTLAAVESRISTVEQQITQTQMTHIDLQAKQDKLNRMITNGQGLGESELSLDEIDNHRDVLVLKQELGRLAQEKGTLEQAYLPNHPKLEQTRVRIASMQTQLMDQKHSLMQALLHDVKDQYQEVVAQEKSLVVMLNEQKADGVRLTQQNQRYQEKMATLAALRKFRNDIANQLREFTLQEEMLESPVVVVDAAHVPNQPSGLSKSHQIASILSLGLLFSLAFVFALDRLSTTARLPQLSSPVSVPAGWPQPYWPMPNMQANAGYPTAPNENEGFPVSPNQSPSPVPQSAGAPMQMASKSGADEMVKLAQLNEIELGKSSYNDLAFSARSRLVHVDQSCAEAAAFRDIGNQLMQRFGQTKQSMVITSAQKSEGKTTCASNLALVLAKAGRQVLLVDANPEAPGLHRVFPGSHGSPSLADVLIDPESLDRALQDADIQALTVLPNESFTPMSGNDIDQVATQVQIWKQSFDWIVFDAGPVDHPFTKALLQTVGKCLCVTSNMQEDRKTLLQEQIELSGAVCIGLVENRHQFQTAEQGSDAIV